MDNLTVKELIKICEELGIIRNSGLCETKAEEVDEAWVDIKARREEVERREVREREQAERRERREREEADRQEHLELKRTEVAILQCSQAPSIASATLQVSGYRIRDQLPPFVVSEYMEKYLVKFEHVV